MLPHGFKPALATAGVAAALLLLAPSRAEATFYVTNLGNNTLVQIAPDGNTTSFSTTGLSGPRDLAFDASGNLYVANSSNGTIEKFTPGGAGSTFTSIGLNGPYSLAFDSRGNLYAANSTDTIERFAPDGTASRFNVIGSPLNDPYGLAFGPGSALAVPEPASLTLFATVLAGLGWTRRRRKAT